MDRELIKKAVEEAENSLKQKQVDEVKKIVLKTLEKERKIEKDIADAKEKVKELEEQKKILKMDIDDLKEGRLDRIAERQEKDEKARTVSVVLIIKEKETIIEKQFSPWQWPYMIIWEKPYVPSYPKWTTFGQLDVYPANSDITYAYSDSNNAFSFSVSDLPTINCSVAKNATIGTYDVNGTIINLR